MKVLTQRWTSVVRLVITAEGPAGTPVAGVPESVKRDCDNPGMTMRLPRGEIWFTAGTGLLAILIGLLAGINGALALAAALSIAFAYAALTNLALGLGLYVFLGFAIAVPQFSGLTLNVIQLAPALPLALSWLAVTTREGRSRPTFFADHPAISLLGFLLIGWAGITIVWAESGSLAFTAALRWGLATALLPITYTAVRTRKDVVIILAAVVAGSAFAAAYGLLSPPSNVPGLQDRLTGTLGDPNQLASAMAVGVALVSGLIATSRSGIAKGIGVGVAAMCLFALFLTASRGGLIALGVMMIATVLLARGRRLSLVLVAVVLSLLAIGYVTAVAPPDARERILNPGSGSGRTDIWTVGARMVEANPIKGVGAGNFPISSIHYLLEPGSLPDDQFIVDTPQVAHNMYLETLTEIGIPGLVMFLTIIVFCLGCAIRALSLFRDIGDKTMASLTMGATVALIGILTADVFLSEEYSRSLWFLLGLGPALLAMAQRSRPESAA